MVIARYRVPVDQVDDLIARLHDYEHLLRRLHLLDDTDVPRVRFEGGEVLEIQQWTDADAPQRAEEDEESRSAWRAIRAQVTDVQQVVLH